MQTRNSECCWSITFQGLGEGQQSGLLVILKTSVYLHHSLTLQGQGHLNRKKNIDLCQGDTGHVYFLQLYCKNDNRSTR